jgi:hypothetical protein
MIEIFERGRRLPTERNDLLDIAYYLRSPLILRDIHKNQGFPSNTKSSQPA